MQHGYLWERENICWKYSVHENVNENMRTLKLFQEWGREDKGK
jgi:hypothetical protein